MENHFFLYTLVLAFFSAFIVTTVITPAVIFFARKGKLIDDPKRNHPAVIHKKRIPRGGGLALFLGAIIPSLYFLPLNTMTLSIYLASLLALCIGLIDDKLSAQSKDVSPYLRFLINILCAVIVVGSGVSIPYVTNPLGGILHLDTYAMSFFGIATIAISDVLALIWIIWVMNMLNWSKGVDGQMPGIVGISAIIIGILSLRFPISNQYVMIDSILSFIIAGASFGFLIYNFYPAKILPGYGATSLYFLLAVVSILSSAKLATAILVMGVPTVDALFTIIRRVLARRSPFLADKRHLHHLLLRFGWSQWKISLFYWGISGILGIIALQLQSRSKLFALVMLLVITGGGIFFLHKILNKENEKTTA